MLLEVKPHEDRERLDRFLATHFPGTSRMRLREALDHGDVSVAGEVKAAGWRLRSGEHVLVTATFETPTGMTPEAISLTLVFEDPTLLVVLKPAGMVVHPAGRHQSGTLVNALAHHFNVVGAADPPIRPGLVHRLDRATSGLMVIAKTQTALSRLTVAFQRKQVVKRYLALLHGVPDPETGEWQAPIGSHPEATPRWGIREDGRPGHSRYRTVEALAGNALVELEPVTGRTNQLRLHAAHFRHPIVGDDLFGRGMEPGLERLFLHAHRLEFVHPSTGESMAFEAPLPPELSDYLDRLRGERAGTGTG